MAVFWLNSRKDVGAERKEETVRKSLGVALDFEDNYKGQNVFSGSRAYTTRNIAVFKEFSLDDRR